MIGIFLYSTFPFLRLEFIAMIKSPSILAVESSFGRRPVNSAIATAMRKSGSIKFVNNVNSSAFVNAVPLSLTCF